jgi:N-acetylgalactosamine-N,N'-diacetylbacillosaminyl-diphospho-undecaprenol 4-alpha-N-acetylgalactosaminyltransferase
LFIIQHLHNGGSEATIAKLSIEFSKYYQVHIATFFSAEKYPISYEYNGVFHCLNESGNSSGFIKVWRRVSFINKIILSNKIDVVISFLFNADLVNALTGSRNHMSIVGLRTSANELINSRIKSILYKYIFNKADIILVQNHENENLISDFLKSSNGHKIDIIPNMFNIERILKKAKESPAFTNKKGIIITALGRFSEVKGHLHLFKILSILKKESKLAFRLVIIGDGELKDKYLSFGKRLGLKIVESVQSEIDLEQGDIFLLGFRSNPFKYIADAHLFVMSSYYEGSPNALAEAMIVGTPVFSSKCEVGPSDLLVSKNQDLPEETDYGVLMPVFDSSSLDYEELSKAEIFWKEKIKSFTEDTVKFEGKARKAQEMMNDYDQGNVIKKWVEVINNC